jgi:hypothetical protein
MWLKRKASALGPRSVVLYLDTGKALNIEYDAAEAYSSESTDELLSVIKVYWSDTNKIPTAAEWNMYIVQNIDRIVDLVREDKDQYKREHPAFDYKLL